MASLNRVMIIGNVGKDVEMRLTPQGKSVSSFNVACNDKFGEQKTIEWVSVVTWGKLAESCNQYLSKGQQVYVEGRLQTRKWDKDGQAHYKTEVIAGKVLFLGKKGNSGEHEQQEIEPADIPF